MSELNREQLKRSLIHWYSAFGELKNYWGIAFDVGGEEERFQQIKSLIEQETKVNNDKLIDDILELVLGDMGCHHEVSLDEDGPSIYAEYNFNNETKVRQKIGELIEEAEERPEVTEEFMEKWARAIVPDIFRSEVVRSGAISLARDLLRTMLKEAGVEVKDG